MNTLNNVLDLLNQYDTFFIDVYGVLYNGAQLYSGTLETMAQLMQKGKNVVIVSNATQSSQSAIDKYITMGMHPNVHYNAYVTSGEAFKHYINVQKISFNNQIAKAYYTLFDPINATTIFKNSSLAEAENIAQADFAYVGCPKVPNNINLLKLYHQKQLINLENLFTYDWNNLTDDTGAYVLRPIIEAINACKQHNKPLITANPDLFAHEKDHKTQQPAPMLRQGAVLKMAQQLGCHTTFFGKPSKQIYDYALAQLTQPAGRVVMIGDTPWTDILGANNAGINSALITETGVAKEFKNLQTAIDKLCDFACKPTHYLKQFSDSAILNKS